MVSGLMFEPPMPSVPLVVMSILVGSSSQVPVLPFAAEVTTDTSGLICRLPPEVSTKPPLPPSEPPFALKVPASVVVPSDAMMISPPLPRVTASAVIVALPIFVDCDLARVP